MPKHIPLKRTRITLKYKDLEPFIGSYRFNPEDDVSGLLEHAYGSLFLQRDGKDTMNEIKRNSHKKALFQEVYQPELRNLRMLRRIAENSNSPQGRLSNDTESVVAAFLAANNGETRGTNANTRRIRLKRKIGMKNLPEHLRDVNTSLFEGNSSSRRNSSRRNSSRRNSSRHNRHNRY